MKITKRQLKRIIREAANYNYEEDIVGQIIEGLKIYAVDNNITHPDKIYELSFKEAKKRGVENKADYIAQIVHGYVDYVLN
jgi:hypothetical protein